MKLTSEKGKNSSQVDDAESITQQFRLTYGELDRQAPLKPDEVLGCLGRACQRPVSDGVEEVQCLFVPNAYQGTVDVDAWYDFKICGKDFTFEVAGVVQPYLVCYNDARRWLAEYDPQPLKAVAKRFRLCLFDAIIEIGRALKSLLVLNVVAWGEGALVITAFLSPELRKLAFSERHLGHEEHQHLEDLAGSLQRVLLLAPHGYPVR